MFLRIAEVDASQRIDVSFYADFGFSESAFFVFYRKRICLIFFMLLVMLLIMDNA